jgi:outer membrane cobalamin receptor
MQAGLSSLANHGSEGAWILGGSYFGWLSAAVSLTSTSTSVTNTSTTTQPAYIDQIYVHARRPVPGMHELDASAAGSAIELSSGAYAGQSVAAALREAPGLRVLQSGAQGSFSGLSLRGAEMQHTSVLFDTVPFGGPDRGALDLSMFPADAFDRIEVYRGGAPVWLGSGAIGGVLRLVPKQVRDTRLAARGQFGSFETFSGGLAGDFDLHPAAVATDFGVRGSQNNYTYRDDSGTRFTEDDDLDRTRQNADYLEAHGLVRSTFETSIGTFGATLFALHRDQGEPGPGSAPALQTRRQRDRIFGTLSYDQSGQDYRAQVYVGAGYEREQFLDALGELGLLQQDTDDRYLSLQGRMAGSYDWTDFLETTLIVGISHEGRDPENKFQTLAVPQSHRNIESLAIETHLHGKLSGMPWSVRPSIRLQWSQAIFQDAPFGISVDQQSNDFAPTWRVGALLSPYPWLTLVASGASGFRLPTILELFGDRGIVLGNPTLTPETSHTVDVGFIVQHCQELLSLTLEGRGFALWLEDLIRFRRTAQFTVAAQNIAQGSVVGAEGSVAVDAFDHLALLANLTALSAEDDRGRALPFRPAWVAYAKLTPRTGPIAPGILDHAAVWCDLEFTGSNFVDPANLVEIGARTWFGTGITTAWFRESVNLSFSVQDLSNTGGSDLLGFPLPGRRFFLNLDFQEMFL